MALILWVVFDITYMNQCSESHKKSLKLMKSKYKSDKFSSQYSEGSHISLDENENSCPNFVLKAVALFVFVLLLLGLFDVTTILS